MIEVFKTNVSHSDEAEWLVERIHEKFRDYKVNFDLEDCDRILRVKSFAGPVNSGYLIQLMSELGYHAEILTDEPAPCRLPLESRS
ncbi:MAG: hypothetical protein C5B59_02295 [Bacteroidetes bacterium]|nr:MAG: hypothetical protein C5B59_02295 [Bacteroidota bacterium]